MIACNAFHSLCRFAIVAGLEFHGTTDIMVQYVMHIALHSEHLHGRQSDSDVLCRIPIRSVTSFLPHPTHTASISPPHVRAQKHMTCTSRIQPVLSCNMEVTYEKERISGQNQCHEPMQGCGTTTQVVATLAVSYTNMNPFHHSRLPFAIDRRVSMNKTGFPSSPRSQPPLVGPRCTSFHCATQVWLRI